jgi:amino acid transporter
MSNSAVSVQPQKTGLRAQCLSFIEVLGQSIANIAPTATPAITIPVVFATAGNGTWLAYLFAMVAIILLSVQINVFSKRSATPGALYTYVSQGLGSASGFVTGSGLVLAYLLTGSAVLCGYVNYANNLFGYAGIKISPTILIIIGILIAWALTYKGVQISAKIMLTIEAISVSLIFILGVIVLFNHNFNIGADQFALKGVSFSSLRFGLVFAFFSFVGFESATAMGHEAKNPLRNIPKAVMGSGIFVGIFFVFMSLIMVMGFVGSKTSLGDSTAPLTYLAQQSHVGIFGLLISICATVSFWSCTVACITAAARVMLSMSKQGLIPATVAKCHKTNDTPHIAIAISCIVIAGVPLALFIFKNSVMDVYNLTGTLSVYGFLFSYVFIAIAAPVYLFKIKQLKPINIITAVIATALLCIPLIGSVYPLPAYPFVLLPFIFLGWLILSLVWYAIANHHKVPLDQTKIAKVKVFE